MTQYVHCAWKNCASLKAKKLFSFLNPHPHFDNVVVDALVERPVDTFDTVEEEQRVGDHIGVVAFLLKGKLFQFECTWKTIANTFIDLVNGPNL